MPKKTTVHLHQEFEETHHNLVPKILKMETVQMSISKRKGLGIVVYSYHTI